MGAEVPRMGGSASAGALLILQGKDEATDAGTLEARQALLRRMDRFHTRLEWRKHMDHSLRRLLIDIELLRDHRLDKKNSHTMRCETLDRVFDWYQQHGKKEMRKEKEAPPFVRFSAEAPVMPGSLRVSRHAWKSQSTPHL